MKTVQSSEQLMRRAARAGASVSIGGRVFNAEGQATTVGQPPKVAPPADPMRELVEALQAQLKASDEASRGSLDRLARLVEAVGMGQATQPTSRITGMRVLRGADGLIQNVEFVRETLS